MRIIYFTLMVMLAIQVNCLSQNVIKSGFGIANLDELNMKTSAYDTSAEAEILIDKEQVLFVVEKDYLIKTSYHGKIKILKKSALDRGTIKLRCIVKDIDREYINNIKGYTYNLENGNVITTKWAEPDVFREKLSEDFSIVKIIAPNLKVGAVIEYQYTRNTPFNVSERPPSWNFQGTVPSRWSEVVAYIPAWFFYKIHCSGYLPFVINEIKDTTLLFDEKWVPGIICRYAIKDIPAFKQEAYTPVAKDCIANLEFELSGYQQRNGKVRYLSDSWRDVYSYLIRSENFGLRLENAVFLEDIGMKFRNIKDTLERIDAIFKYITNEVKWNGDFGLGAGSLYKAFQSKLTGGTEINMLLVALMRNANLKANMAVLSTRGNGKINIQMPSTDKFNLGIAHTKVNGKDVFIDATEKYSKPNMLPFYSAVKDMFIVEPDTGRLATFKPKDRRWNYETIQYNLNLASFEMSANYEIIHGGYEGIETKRYIDKNGKDEFLKQIIKDNSDWQIDSLIVEHKDRNDGSVQIKYVFTGLVSHQDNSRIYFNPIHQLRFIKNPFDADQRIYPIDFATPIENISLVKLTVPDGYELIDLPSSQNIALPEKAGKFSYFVELKDKELQVRSHLSLSKTYFNPEEYKQLRDFFSLVVENQAKLIVLKKL